VYSPEDHVITLAWLDAHRTADRSWTRAQIEALGLTWTPTHGWQGRLVGQRITQAARAAFEAGKTKFSDRTLLRRAKRAARVAALPGPGRSVDFVARHERQLQALQAVFAGACTMALDRPLTSDDLQAIFANALRALEA